MSSETATMTDATLTAPAVDPDKLMAFVFRAVEEAGAALNCALVVMEIAWAITATWPNMGRAHLPNWPNAPTPTRTMPGNGSTRRPPVHSSPTTQRRADTTCHLSRPSR